jgi:phosphohistidine swiveling domain-containing protein
MNKTMEREMSIESQPLVGQYVLSLSDARTSLAVAGGKGASLSRLAQAGLPVPDGFHVTTAAYKSFVAENNLQPRILETLETVDVAVPSTLELASGDIGHMMSQATMPEDIAKVIVEAYQALAGNEPVVAVRSSATAEDLPDLSFAGQQETFLNVQGPGGLLEAVRACWASLWTARAIGYRARNKIDSEAISLAVVVQLMVPAEAAGVMFTANPITGRHDQMLVNAAWGLGEAIVGGQVTPDTLTLDKETGRVITRETADKQQMTVGLNGGTATRPVPDHMRRLAVLDDDEAAELARLGRQIEALYDSPTDIEWTLADGVFAIVQARPITALPEPEAPTPTEWPLPDPKGKYMRVSIIDLMPDPLTPLFSTMGIAAINSGLKRLIGREARTEPKWPDETIFTINGYAFMLVQYRAGEWFFMFSRLLPRFPSWLRHGLARWRDEAYPHYADTVARWEAKRLTELAPSELLAGARELADEAVDHLGSLMIGTMGVSAGSEGLFTKVYDRLIKRPGDPWAATFLMGYDSMPIRAEKSLYDLTDWCRDRQGFAKAILNTPTEQLAAQLKNGRPPAGVDEADWETWRQKFDAHMQQYGHIIYDLDFGRPLPMDDPTPMLETCKMYLRGLGINPHERQQKLAQQREEQTEEVLNRVKGLRRKIFQMALAFAQRQAQVREDGIASIGLGYPVLREMFLELGRRFVQAGMISQEDDVFWLTQDELQGAALAIEQDRPITPMFDEVSGRKALWRARKRVSVPPQLPPGATYLGLNAESWLPVDASSQVGNTIKGVAASPGRVSGAACVLHGPEDFDEMQPGEVLVAPITTPAWTPLFAMALAVVTDVGGPLSHGSIVAREYGIPAVLGTGVATKRIENGQLITVDGDQGLVLLPDEPADH